MTPVTIQYDFAQWTIEVEIPEGTTQVAGDKLIFEAWLAKNGWKANCPQINSHSWKSSVAEIWCVWCQISCEEISKDTGESLDREPWDTESTVRAFDSRSAAMSSFDSENVWSDVETCPLERYDIRKVRSVRVGRCILDASDFDGPIPMGESLDCLRGGALEDWKIYGPDDHEFVAEKNQ